jgi:hypothetical protein
MYYRIFLIFAFPLRTATPESLAELRKQVKSVRFR